jgi:hypothetical protein
MADFCLLMGILILVSCGWTWIHLRLLTPQVIRFDEEGTRSIMTFDTDDFDPLPAINPRTTSATIAAKVEISMAIRDIRERYSLTFAEVFWCLGETLRWWSESALDAERRRGDS